MLMNSVPNGAMGCELSSKQFNVSLCPAVGPTTAFKPHIRLCSMDGKFWECAGLPLETAWVLSRVLWYVCACRALAPSSHASQTQSWAQHRVFLGRRVRVLASPEGQLRD